MNTRIKLTAEGNLVTSSFLTGNVGYRLSVCFGAWEKGFEISCNAEFLSFYGISSNELEHHLEQALVFLHDSDNTSVQAWCSKIPSQHIETVLKFSGYSLRMLRMAAAYSDAEQLLKNAPVLLWLIAIVSRDEEWTENQLIDCFASKRQIIIGRLGFKARRCALTVMNKLDISQYNENALTELKLWLSYDQLSELVHYPKINLEQLKLLRLCPFLMRSSFSFKRTAIAEIENIQQFSQILNDCIQMAEQLSQLAEVLHQLKKVASLTRFDEIHAQLTNKIQRKNCFNSRVNYSCPPLLGASEIVPITNSVDLYLEGEQQNHCIFSYHDDIVSGAYYVYQVLQPQRATLGLQINDGKPQLDQVFLHSNKSVSASTINRINFWLSQKEKLTKSICGQRIKVELLSGNKPKTSGIKGNREKTIKVKECKDSRNYNSDLKQRHMFEIEQSMAEYDVFIAELQN